MVCLASACSICSIFIFRSLVIHPDLLFCAYHSITLPGAGEWALSSRPVCRPAAQGSGIKRRVLCAKNILSSAGSDKKQRESLWKLPKPGPPSGQNGFVNPGRMGQNRQNAENLSHGAGRLTLTEKLAKNPQKGLTTGVLPCILNQYHKNGIERPKGILHQRRSPKLCEKRRICPLSQRSLWGAFANFVNLWNRSGRVLW